MLRPKGASLKVFNNYIYQRSGVSIKQGRKRPLDTPKRMIEKEGEIREREKERQRDRYREREIRKREREIVREREREVKGIER